MWSRDASGVQLTFCGSFTLPGIVVVPRACRSLCFALRHGGEGLPRLPHRSNCACPLACIGLLPMFCIGLPLAHCQSLAPSLGNAGSPCGLDCYPGKSTVRAPFHSSEVLELSCSLRA